MSLTISQREFLESAEAAQIKEALTSMANDSAFNTKETYIANGDAYPGNHISFVEKHMQYLSVHRNVSPQQYLSNLRLMTRYRQR